MKEYHEEEKFKEHRGNFWIHLNDIMPESICLSINSSCTAIMQHFTKEETIVLRDRLNEVLAVMDENKAEQKTEVKKE